MSKTPLSSNAAFRDLCERNAQQVLRKYGLDTRMISDESESQLREFLKDRLSPEDHEQACKLIEGSSSQEKTGAADERMRARDGFYARFPGAAKIKIDNSGIPIPRRAARHDAADAKSFAERYPDAMKIRLA